MMYATIDATGIHTPTYNDVLEELKDNYRIIYGEDIYLEPDSQDGQLVAVLALAIKDANDMAVATYNAFSPTTAVGAGLSSVVKVNGIRRLIASYSTVVVTLTGQAGTVITNGIVADNITSNNWLLPETVIIDNTGEATVTATAQASGAIYTSIGTVDRIITIVPGWQEVTNPVASIPGAPIEIDADLRRRQALSVMYPAETVRDSIHAGIANIFGVQRLKVYENWTGATDENGIPGHSIAAVVEGGDVFDVATAIAYRKPPGTGTYGDITQVIVDTHGVPNTINLFELISTRVKVVVFISALPGYIASTADLVKTSISYWLNNQEVGVGSYYSRLIPPLELSGTSAIEATGKTQDELNQLSKTFIAVGVAQATPDMTVIGSYPTGTTSVEMLALNTISKGDICYIMLDNGIFWKIVITAVVGNVIYFDDYPIQEERNIPDGSLVYISDDLEIDFKAATIAEISDIAIVGGSLSDYPYPLPPTLPPSPPGTAMIVANSSLTIPNGFNGVVMVQHTAPITITLSLIPISGQQVTVKDSVGLAATHNITVVGTIEGSSNVTIIYNYGWVPLMYTGTQWVQI